MESNIITIDGPASSGKSTIGLLFAQKIGYQFIDSGSLFRLAAIVALKNNLSLSNGQVIAGKLEQSKIEFAPDGVGIYINGEDVTPLLHAPETTAAVSEAAAQPQVRKANKRILRKLGLAQNTVMAGRDIGSAIFPEAKLKFFITASPEVRAKRRFEQLKNKGLPVHFDEILRDIIRRDEKDSGRAVDPLKIPDDAVVVDTSELTIEKTIGFLEKYLSY